MAHRFHLSGLAIGAIDIGDPVGIGVPVEMAFVGAPGREFRRARIADGLIAESAALFELIEIREDNGLAAVGLMQGRRQKLPGWGCGEMLKFITIPEFQHRDQLLIGMRRVDQNRASAGVANTPELVGFRRYGQLAHPSILEQNPGGAGVQVAHVHIAKQLAVVGGVKQPLQFRVKGSGSDLDHARGRKGAEVIHNMRLDIDGAQSGQLMGAVIAEDDVAVGSIKIRLRHPAQRVVLQRRTGRQWRRIESRNVRLLKFDL